MNSAVFFPMNLVAVLLFATASSGESIGDFAPMEIGSVWEYQYRFVYLSGHLGNSAASTSIKVELASKEIVGSDSLIILHIQENGVSKSEVFPSLSDTTIVINTEFMDTVITRGDSVYATESYKCPIFPFWKTHTICLDSLRINFSGNDSLYFKIALPKSGTKEVYLQNVGLYSFKEQIQAILGKGFDSISLVKYECGRVQAALPASHKSSMLKPVISSGHALNVFLSPSTVSGFDLFSLNGKKIGTTNRTAACIGIGKEKISTEQLAK
jgi:hypothetical protein